MLINSDLSVRRKLRADEDGFPLCYSLQYLDLYNRALKSTPEILHHLFELLGSRLADCEKYAIPGWCRCLAFLLWEMPAKAWH